MQYVIWLTEQAAWLTKAGTGSTQLSAAQRYSREGAIHYCQARFAGGHKALPVQVFDLEEIAE